MRYELTLRGRLGRLSTAALGACRVRDLGDDSVIDVELADQAELHGLLATLQDLGIELVGLTAVVEPTAPADDS
ncbi:MAG TPA: hypothetical protein VK866_19545 [Acidimicrobiales bacterium]|nr:hypothetical protein [Acidimicrobiales bacterium]